MTDLQQETTDNKGEEAMNEPVASVQPENGAEAEPPLTYLDFRNASYVVLFIAAIFLINSMETGSYRAPWPVGICLALVGAGLFGYSIKRRKDEAQAS